MIVAPFPSHAFKQCKCKKEPNTQEQEQKRAFGIFSGEVIEVDRKFSPDRHKIFFQVEKSWKGVTNETVSVYTSGTDLVALIREGLTCGYRFEVGQKYLVYAFRKRNRRGPAHVSICSRTQLLANADEEIKVLGAPLHNFVKEEIPVKKSSDYNLQPSDEIDGYAVD